MIGWWWWWWQIDTLLLPQARRCETYALTAAPVHLQQHRIAFNHERVLGRNLFSNPSLKRCTTPGRGRRVGCAGTCGA